MEQDKENFSESLITKLKENTQKDKNKKPSPLWGFIFMLCLVYWAVRGVIYLTEMPARESQENRTPQTNYSSGSAKGDGYLIQNAVFCTSESAFDRQVNLLARNQIEFSSGCFATSSQQNVWLRKTHLFSGSCVVERLSDSRVLYTFCEDYNAH